MDYEETIDYEELLKKYMQHVGEYEGSTFVSHLNSSHCDVTFTLEEIERLQSIHSELPR